MRTFALIYICLSACFNVSGADKQAPSPTIAGIEASGTASLSAQCRQRLGLPEKIAFELKGKVDAKPVAKKAGRSQAVATYSLVVRDAVTAQVHLDIKTTFTLESADPPDVVQTRAHEAVIRSAVAALGLDSAAQRSTNAVDLKLNLQMK